jgi:hypothetical protein
MVVRMAAVKVAVRMEISMTFDVNGGRLRGCELV